MIAIVTKAEEQFENSNSAKGPEAETKTEITAAQPAPALIVFGADKDGKPHASWFPESDTALATKAAGVMSMRALPLDTEDRRAIAVRSPLSFPRVGCSLRVGHSCHL